MSDWGWSLCLKEGRFCGIVSRIVFVVKCATPALDMHREGMGPFLLYSIDLAWIAERLRSSNDGGRQVSVQRGARGPPSEMLEPNTSSGIHVSGSSMEQVRGM